MTMEVVALVSLGDVTQIGLFPFIAVSHKEGKASIHG